MLNTLFNLTVPFETCIEIVTRFLSAKQNISFKLGQDWDQNNLPRMYFTVEYFPGDFLKYYLQSSITQRKLKNETIIAIPYLIRHKIQGNYAAFKKNMYDTEHYYEHEHETYRSGIVTLIRIDPTENNCLLLSVNCYCISSIHDRYLSTFICSQTFGELSAYLKTQIVLFPRIQFLQLMKGLKKMIYAEKYLLNEWVTREIVSFL
jgi:hypothetical protein